jgi:hypothetical protein
MPFEAAKVISWSSVVVAMGSVCVALIGSWLSKSLQRRSDLKIKISNPDGVEGQIKAADSAELNQLLAKFKEYVGNSDTVNKP